VNPSNFAILLPVLLVGCAAPMPQPGLTGAVSPRDEGAPPPTDAAAVTLSKGRLHVVHHVDARESCGGRCALISRASSLVTMVLGPNGAAEVTDEGSLVEDFESTAGGTAHKTDWRRRLTGSWTHGDDELKLRMEPAGLDCTRTSAAGKVETPCQERALELVCIEKRVRLSKPKNQRVRSWVCSAQNDQGIVGATPLPWVFGIDAAIASKDKIRGPRQRRKYWQPRQNRPPAAK
jgi:hypothetical protein